MEIEKITKPNKKTFLRGLSQKQAYQLEKKILLLLETNFKCVCGLNTYHFPKIVSCVDVEYKFKLTNCGTSLDVTPKESKIPNQDEQINCIVENMKKSNIQHLDVVNTGQNICLDTDGTLSVIDFDIASINEVFLSTEIQDRFEMSTNQKPQEWYAENELLHLYKGLHVEEFYSYIGRRLRKILYHFKRGDLRTS